MYIHTAIPPHTCTINIGHYTTRTLAKDVMCCAQHIQTVEMTYDARPVGVSCRHTSCSGANKFHHSTLCVHMAKEEEAEVEVVNEHSRLTRIPKTLEVHNGMTPNPVPGLLIQPPHPYSLPVYCCVTEWLYSHALGKLTI